MTFLKQPGPTHLYFQGGGEYLPGVLQELVDHYGRCPSVHVKIPPSARSFRSNEDFLQRWRTFIPTVSEHNKGFATSLVIQVMGFNRGKKKTALYCILGDQDSESQGGCSIEKPRNITESTKNLRGHGGANLEPIMAQKQCWGRSSFSSALTTAYNKELTGSSHLLWSACQEECLLVGLLAPCISGFPFKMSLI